MSQSNKLFNSFDPASKADWLDKIKTDLKGKPINSLSATWSSGKSISPFYHSDDLVEDIQIPQWSSLHPSLGFEIAVKDETFANGSILEALKGGVSLLNIDLSESGEVDFAKLFRDVLIDLVQIRIKTNHQSKIESFISYIFDQYDLEQVQDNITFCTTASIDTSFSQIKTCRSDQSTDSLATLLIEGHTFIERAEPGSFAYRVMFGHRYTQNIVHVRAARLLWANLCELHEVESDHYPLIIEGIADVDELSNDEHSTKIALSQMAVSMMSASLDIIYIPPSDVREQENGTSFTRRISRNIYNLLMMEGHMSRVIDPAAGSYLFDRLTVDIAKEAWDQFKKRN